MEDNRPFGPGPDDINRVPPLEQTPGAQKDNGVRITLLGVIFGVILAFGAFGVTYVVVFCWCLPRVRCWRRRRERENDGGRREEGGDGPQSGE